MQFGVVVVSVFVSMYPDNLHFLWLLYVRFKSHSLLLDLFVLTCCASPLYLFWQLFICFGKFHFLHYQYMNFTLKITVVILGFLACHDLVLYTVAHIGTYIFLIFALNSLLFTAHKGILAWFNWLLWLLIRVLPPLFFLCPTVFGHLVIWDWDVH